MTHSTKRVSKNGHQLVKKSKFQSCPNEMKFSEYLVISVRCSEMYFFMQNCKLGHSRAKINHKGMKFCVFDPLIFLDNIKTLFCKMLCMFLNYKT